MLTIWPARGIRATEATLRPVDGSKAKSCVCRGLWSNFSTLPGCGINDRTYITSLISPKMTCIGTFLQTFAICSVASKVDSKSV